MQKSFGSFCCACQISLSNVGNFACEKLLIEMQTFFKITNKSKGVKEAISWNGTEFTPALRFSEAFKAGTWLMFNEVVIDSVLAGRLPA